MNLTPHAVSVLDAAGMPLAVYPPSGQVARCAQGVEPAGCLGPVPVVRCRLGAVVDLPGPVRGRWLIVSRSAADAARTTGRPVTDLLVPHELVRDTRGVVIGCRSLALVT